MSLSAERLVGAKKDLEDAAAALQTGDKSNVSQEGRRLVDELMLLEDAERSALLASVEDSELRDLLDLVIQRASTVKMLSAGTIPQIRQIWHHESFFFSQQSLMIGLRFNNAEGKLLLDSNQDLNDTLWIGAALVAVVSDVMQAMDGSLNPEAQRGCIGTAFEENLKNAEDAVEKIRRIFTALRGADTPDESG